MNYTQNEKIEQVTDSTIVVGVDIGSQIHYARAFDNRGRELTKRVFSFHNDLEGFNSFNLWAETLEYSCAMKSHFRKFGNQMSGSGNHLCKVTLALIYPSHKPHAWICHAQHQCL